MLRASPVAGFLPADEFRAEGAHFAGLSWSSRLGYGIGEHASERVSSLVDRNDEPVGQTMPKIAELHRAMYEAVPARDFEQLGVADAGVPILKPDDRP